MSFPVDRRPGYPLDRCVCSHPRAIHIGGGVCARCGCGAHLDSAAGYTKEEREGWQAYLLAPNADWLAS
jgi:hypothetical protein